MLAQSFTDFELILVDDGSPDKCGEICDELAKRDARIRVFHQANRGEALARGLGVENARGEWINFVDADDLLPKDSLRGLISEATDDTDWVQGGLQSFNDGETPKEEAKIGTIKNFDPIGLAEDLLLYNTSVWGKIIRKKLFSTNVFEISRDIKIGPDTLMGIRLIAKSNLRCFFTYLCLSVGCPGIAIAAAKVCHFLHGMKFDARDKKLLE